MNKIRSTSLGVTSTNYNVTSSTTNLVLATTKEINLILLNCFLHSKLGWLQLEQGLINNNKGN